MRAKVQRRGNKERAANRVWNRDPLKGTYRARIPLGGFAKLDGRAKIKVRSRLTLMPMLISRVLCIRMDKRASA
jgi:hypothetical protein